MATSVECIMRLLTPAKINSRTDVNLMTVGILSECGEEENVINSDIIAGKSRKLPHKT